MPLYTTPLSASPRKTKRAEVLTKIGQDWSPGNAGGEDMFSGMGKAQVRRRSRSPRGGVEQHLPHLDPNQGMMDVAAAPGPDHLDHMFNNNVPPQNPSPGWHNGPAPPHSSSVAMNGAPPPGQYNPPPPLYGYPQAAPAPLLPPPPFAPYVNQFTAPPPVGYMPAYATPTYAAPPPQIFASPPPPVEPPPPQPAAPPSFGVDQIGQQGPPPMRQHANIMSPPQAPPEGRRGRGRPRAEAAEEDSPFWRLGMGGGVNERQKRVENSKDRYRQELELQIEAKKREKAELQSKRRSLAAGEDAPPGGVTAPGERVDRDNYAYGRIRGDAATEAEVSKRRAREVAAKQLQDDLALQIEENRMRKEAEALQRKLSEERWNDKYGPGAAGSPVYSAGSPKAARKGSVAPEQKRELVKVEENKRAQQDAAAALADPKFAPLRKVYHHQKARGTPDDWLDAPAVMNEGANELDDMAVGGGGGAVMAPKRPRQREPPSPQQQVVHTPREPPPQPQEAVYHTQPQEAVYHTPVQQHFAPPLPPPPPPPPQFNFRPLPTSVFPDSVSRQQEDRLLEIAAAQRGFGPASRPAWSASPTAGVLHDGSALAPLLRVAGRHVEAPNDMISYLSERNRQRLHQLQKITTTLENHRDLDSAHRFTRAVHSQSQGNSPQRESPARRWGRDHTPSPSPKAPHTARGRGACTPPSLASPRVGGVGASDMLADLMRSSSLTLPGKSEWLAEGAELPEWLQDSGDQEQQGQHGGAEELNADPVPRTKTFTTASVLCVQVEENSREVDANGRPLPEEPSNPAPKVPPTIYPSDAAEQEDRPLPTVADAAAAAKPPSPSVAVPSSEEAPVVPADLLPHLGTPPGTPPDPTAADSATLPEPEEPTEPQRTPAPTPLPPDDDDDDAPL